MEGWVADYFAGIVLVGGLIVLGIFLLILAAVTKEKQKPQPWKDTQEIRVEDPQCGAKFCPECGTEIRENIKFCPECGNPIASPVRIVYQNNGRTCPKCYGQMQVQTISVPRKSGCGTVLLYILLALTIFGLLIVIPLMLRNKSETATYAVCQKCGYKEKI